MPLDCGVPYLNLAWPNLPEPHPSLHLTKPALVCGPSSALRCARPDLWTLAFHLDLAPSSPCPTHPSYPHPFVDPPPNPPLPYLTRPTWTQANPTLTHPSFVVFGASPSRDFTSRSRTGAAGAEPRLPEPERSLEGVSAWAGR